MLAVNENTKMLAQVMLPCLLKCQGSSYYASLQAKMLSYRLQDGYDAALVEPASFVWSEKWKVPYFKDLQIVTHKKCLIFLSRYNLLASLNKNKMFRVHRYIYFSQLSRAEGTVAPWTSRSFTAGPQHDKDPWSRFNSQTNQNSGACCLIYSGLIDFSFFEPNFLPSKPQQHLETEQK